MSFSLGSLAITANTPATFQAPDSGVKGILIGNESGLTVTVTMESGGVQKTLYPSMLDWFAVRHGFTGNIKIAPTVILNNTSSFPASSLIFDAIGLNDPEDASMYPVHMPRNTNIGNSVTAVGGTSSSIINDNNAADTQFIEATATGDGASAVSLTNSGVLVLGNTTHHGSISSDNATFTTDGSGNVTTNDITVASGHKITTPETTGRAASDLVLNAVTGQAIRLKINEVEQARLDAADLILTNNLLITGGKVGASADGDIIDANSATSIFIKARTAGTINFQTPNGSTQASVDVNGITLASGKQVDVSTAGKIKFQAGSVTRFTGFSGTGSGSTSTNLGAAPNQIAFNPCTVSGSSQTIGGTNAQTSVVTTGAGLAWGGMAFKDT